MSDFLSNSTSAHVPEADSVEPDRVIPVIAEELAVEKRRVENGTVRIAKTVHQRAETVTELLTSEHVYVERVPRDEFVDAPPPVRMDGDVTVVPIVEEVLVVTKRLHLKEELRVIKKQVVHEHHQEVTLRREELIVERFNDSELSKFHSSTKENTMSQTVVGLFETPADAEKVKQLLVQEGYPPANIRSFSNESDGFSQAAVAGATSTGTGDTGVMASIKNFFHSLTSSDSSEQDYYTRGVSSGGALLAVTVADERVESITSLLETHGALDIREESAQSSGRPAAYAAGSGTAASAALKAAGEAIPVVEEELQVGKRQYQRGGVRVYSHIIETPVEEAVRLREEQVRVQRTPVDRVASAADFDTFKEGTIELTATGEEAVVAKQARVVEEVTVGKDVSERTQTVRDTVRHTEVEIEEIPGEGSPKSRSAGKL